MGLGTGTPAELGPGDLCIPLQHPCSQHSSGPGLPIPRSSTQRQSLEAVGWAQLGAMSSHIPHQEDTAVGESCNSSFRSQNQKINWARRILELYIQVLRGNSCWCEGSDTGEEMHSRQNSAVCITEMCHTSVCHQKLLLWHIHVFAQSQHWEAMPAPSCSSHSSKE